MYIFIHEGAAHKGSFEKSALLTAKQNATVSSDTIGKPLDRVGSFSAPSQAASSRQPAEARFCTSLTCMPGPLRPLPAHAGSLAAASATSPGGTGFLMLPTVMPGPCGPQQAAALSTMGLSVHRGSWGEAVRLQEARKDFEVRES